MSAAPLIWINGFPGVGKLTIAKALAALYQNIVVVDNHQLIDPVEEKFPRTHPDYQRQRYLVREAAFTDYVLDPSTRSQIVVFTDFQSSNSLGSAVATSYRQAALRANRPFIPVYMDCGLSENMSRLQTPTRLTGGTGKVVDVEFLVALRGRCALFHFDDSDPENGFAVTLDVTELSPHEAARVIWRSIEQVWDGAVVDK